EKGNRGGRGRGGYRGARGEHREIDGRNNGRDNWREARNGSQQGRHSGRRSDGYTGFSTGSFGVMGDADSINCSSNSPELAAEIPIASVEDFRYEAGRDPVQVVESNLNSDGQFMNSTEYKEIRVQHGSSNNVRASCHALDSAQPVQESCSYEIDGQRETLIETASSIPINANLSKCEGLPRGACARSASYHVVRTEQSFPEMVNRCKSSHFIAQHNIPANAPHISMNSLNGPVTAKSPVLSATIEAAMYPSDPDLKTALEHHNDIAMDNVNGIDIHDCQSVLPPRRVRSLSQTMINASGGGSLREDRRSSMKSSFMSVAEEEGDALADGGEAQIRSIHNDGHFNNHRLSKVRLILKKISFTVF
ncbi:hypothetical protein COOONC_11656, partial [Cooperia oncophora]